MIRSVVGLVSIPSGVFNGRLLAVPAMTLIYFSPFSKLTLLYSDLGALAVALSKLQIVQDKFLALIFNGGLYGILRILYIFHLITVAQFHAADADGSFFLLGNLIYGKA